MFLRKIGLAVVICGLGASCGWGMAQAKIDAKWNAIVAEQDARKAGSAAAEELRRFLDGQAVNESLYNLWRWCRDEDPQVRLRAAWSILKNVVPGGDPARWNEVNYFLLPQEIPKAFMVIDGLYTALIELPRVPGGDWLAAELLRAFARSSHGRYDFLNVCPEPVASAVEGIAERTSLRGSWKARHLGRLPIARPCDGIVTESRAVSEQMQFLDGAGLPANNGSYAWDRTSGRIYRVVSSNEKVRWRLDD